MEESYRLLIWDLGSRGIYYLCSENKDADQLRGKLTVQLICAIVFVNAKVRFSHNVAHLLSSSVKQAGKFYYMVTHFQRHIFLRSS